MSSFKHLGRAFAAVSLLSAFAAPAQEACNPVTVLEDPAGDWTGTLSSLGAPQGAGLPEHDILSLQISQSGDELLVFTLKVQPFTSPALLPNSVWYTSFETPPDGVKYGVRLETDDVGTESMYSYLVAPGGLEDDGPSDGRFAEDGSAVPVEAGSGRAADGTIKLVVKASSLGIFDGLAGRTLGPFNAATIQGANLVAVRGAFTVDQMPDSLGRDGFYDFQACGGKSGSGLLAGGSLSATTLLWLTGLTALAVVRRRRLPA